MKKLPLFLVTVTIIIGTITACNNSCEPGTEAVNEGHTCSKTCSSTCEGNHAHDIAGDFDFAMSSVCQASCGESDYDKSDIVDIANAEIGDITMCPVSGAIYRVKESSPILEHAGESFYSCCDGCAKKFKEDPERFYKNV